MLREQKISKISVFLACLFPKERGFVFCIRFFSNVVLEGFGAALLFLR